ncbi:22660_t:CDS:2 [Entrophospora sp. SA101]|nr:22660_t:CDS:2 [Entrophospora sp. SA101]
MQLRLRFVCCDENATLDCSPQGPFAIPPRQGQSQLISPVSSLTRTSRSRSRPRSRPPRSISRSRSRHSYSSYSSRSGSYSSSRENRSPVPAAPTASTTRGRNSIRSPPPASSSRHHNYTSSSRRQRRSSLSPILPTKIMVNKLTKNVKEAHLQEIFGAFGRINRIEVLIDEKWQTNKGTAYIDFETGNDAERAISYMDGGQLDGNTLSCTFVPRRQPSPPPIRRRHTIRHHRFDDLQLAVIVDVEDLQEDILDLDQDHHQFVAEDLILTVPTSSSSSKSSVQDYVSVNKDQPNLLNDINERLPANTTTFKSCNSRKLIIKK